MMETLFELRAKNGFCRLFDFFEEAFYEKLSLIAKGEFTADDLFINRVVTE